MNSLGRKRVLFAVLIAVMLAALSVIMIYPRFSEAALTYNQTEFSRIYNVKEKGEIKITGNTLLQPDSRRYTPTEITSSSNGTSYSNNSYVMGNVDYDSDSTTRNSSSANVTIAPTAKIEKAFLIWGGCTKAGGNGQDAPAAEVSAGPKIKFKAPNMTSYATVSPDKTCRFQGFKNDYSSYADVTALVQQGGAGTYWAGDLPLATGIDTYGGWSLVLVYLDDTLPKNDMTVFFGHRAVWNGSDLSINLDGLVTPPAGTVHAKLGTVMWEGDISGTGDYATFGKVASVNNPRLSDAMTPSNNLSLIHI